MPDGTIVKEKAVLDLLNRRSNPGEDSFAFRYRLSAQLLTSTRGAFVEILRSRTGEPIALHLLPPQYTAAIPDPKKYVAGFEVELPGLPRQILNPKDVLWFKHPHPLDPYLSMTPMESCGVAIEIENLAKYYNRNFLLNDGRPGGLVVVRGELEEDDKDELRSRFRGGIGRAGATTVIASEEGVDFVDTGASPRDAAYVEMRQITKEEILAAFGVPESVTGNASGRTFSNAGEELRVFWLETIPPHLEMIARGMDNLDDDLYFEFDTSNVPILIMAKQERQRYVMDEFQQGLATANEYRESSGRKPVDSELADSMLANPNLTPIGNTKKKLEMPAAPGGFAGPPGGMGGEAPPPGAPDAEAAPPAETPPVEPFRFETPAAEPAPAQQASAWSGGSVDVKSYGGLDGGEWAVKAEAATDRWEATLDRSLERFFERQQRVVTEKALGSKARKSLIAGTLVASAVFDNDTWNRQIAEDLRPVLSGIIAEAAAIASEKVGGEIDINSPAVQEYLDAQMERIQKANETTKSEISDAIKTALNFNARNEEDRHLLLKAAVLATFLHLAKSRRKSISEHEAQSAYNAGTYFVGVSADSDESAGTSGPILRKVWTSRKDSKVRATHKILDGKSVGAGSAFQVEGAAIRFPGDPMAPPSLTYGCRCRLSWGLA
jgi:HK97 family phage portal protein